MDEASLDRSPEAVNTRSPDAASALLRGLVSRLSPGTAIGTNSDFRLIICRLGLIYGFIRRKTNIIHKMSAPSACMTFLTDWYLWPVPFGISFAVTFRFSSRCAEVERDLLRVAYLFLFFSKKHE